MSGSGTHRAVGWLDQARSDVRTATALFEKPTPMEAEDIGCHVAALCAQAVEKSIEGCVVLAGAIPARKHRAYKYLTPLLRGDMLGDHRSVLARTFDTKTKDLIRCLLDLTPGAFDKADVPNTEYPWSRGGGTQSPAGASEFGDLRRLREWVKAARRVSDTIAKLVVAEKFHP